MPVKIVNRAYSEPYTDDEINWFLGNVGDSQTLVLDIESGIIFQATRETPLSIDYTDNSFILTSGKSWGDLGFDIGMEVTFVFDITVTDFDGTGSDSTSTTTNNYTIKEIFGSEMVVNETIQAENNESMPVDLGTESITNVSIYGESDIQGSKITYGHITNSNYESENLNSLNDGTETSFSLPSINGVSVGNWQFMDAIGYQSGMAIKSAEIRKVESFADGDGISAEYEVIRFVITFNPREFSGANNDIDIYTIGLSLDDSDSSIFQSISLAKRLDIDSLGRTTNQQQSDMFIHDANGDSQRQVLFDFQFRIDEGTFEAIDSVYSISLVLFRYSNGLAYAEKTYLQTFLNADELLGQLLTINKLLTLNISDGDSYSLGMEFYGIGDGRSQAKVSFESGGSVKVSKEGERFTTVGSQYFQVRLNYLIVPLFEDVSDVENRVLPGFLDGTESLTDNIKLYLYPIWNNPNVSISNEISETKRLGNTGWFNENFNELNNNFNLEDIDYFDVDGNSVEQLDYQQAVKIKAIVSGVSNINTDSEFGFGFSWLPENQDDYQLKETPYHRNLFMQTGDSDNGFGIDTVYSGPYFGFGTSGASMDLTDVKFSAIDGNLVFEGTLTPNTEFSYLFDQKDDDDRNYVIWLSIANSSLERNFSDRVSLIVDVSKMEKNVPDAGSYDQIEAAFIAHPLGENSAGTTELQAIVQDDILVRMPFRIKNDESIVFQSITFGIDSFNASLDEDFDLQSYQIDLSSYPIDSSGVQQISFDKTRGFKMNSGNNKNWVKINRNDGGDTVDYNSYIAYYAFKIRWEDWINNNNAPSDFFNSLESNNGFHNDWVNYLRTNGWVISFFTEIVAFVDGELLQYRNRWEFNFADYDENIKINTDHRYYRDSDNTLINVGTDTETGKPLGVVLSSSYTRVEIDFEINDGESWSLIDTYGIITIEIDNGPGQLEQRQLSSVWPSESDNPLVPLQGETSLSMVLSNDDKTVTLSCLVDPEILDTATKYRITGRIGCRDLDSEGQFSSGIYEFRYETKYE